MSGPENTINPRPLESNGNEDVQEEEVEEILISEPHKRKTPFIPLDLSKEQTLIEKARAGDASAKEALVESQIRFIKSMARIFREAQYRWYPDSSPIPTEDFVQAGIVGLLEAINKSDRDRGVKLLTYAAYWIRREMIDLIKKTGPIVRTPNQAHKAKYKGAKANVVRARHQISIDSFLPPDDSDEENLLPSHERWQRIENVFSDPEVETVFQAVEDREDIDPANLARVAGLTPREEQILRLRYFTDPHKELPYEKVGKVLVPPLSRPGVIHIERKILRKIRDALLYPRTPISAGEALLDYLTSRNVTIEEFKKNTETLWVDSAIWDLEKVREKVLRWYWRVSDPKSRPFSVRETEMIDQWMKWGNIGNSYETERFVIDASHKISDIITPSKLMPTSSENIDNALVFLKRLTTVEQLQQNASVIWGEHGERFYMPHSPLLAEVIDMFYGKLLEIPSFASRISRRESSSKISFMEILASILNVPKRVEK